MKMYTVDDLDITRHPVHWRARQALPSGLADMTLGEHAEATLDYRFDG